MLKRSLFASLILAANCHPQISFGGGGSKGGSNSGSKSENFEFSNNKNSGSGSVDIAVSLDELKLSNMILLQFLFL